MADFTLSKSLFSGKYRNASSTPGNIAYALFVLFCFWAGAQLLNPFLVGCLIFAVVALWLHWRHRRQ